MKHIFIITLVSLSLFSACEKNNHIESTSTGMFMNTINHSGYYESQPILVSPKAIWKYKTNGQVISSPVVADGIIYVGSTDKNMYALDEKSGSLKWKFATNGTINSTPLIANGKVMFLSYDGFFYALNQYDGSLIWKYQTEGEEIFKVKDYYNGTFKPDFWDFYLSSAAEDDGLVYFGSSDAHIYALKVKTGELEWKYKTEGSIHSSPAIYKNTLVVGSWDSNVYCLDAKTGSVKWVNETGKDTKDYIWIGVQASPTISDGVVYIGSRDAKFYAFDWETGETIWSKDEFDKSWMPSSAAYDSNNLYTGSSDSFSFFSIDKTTGGINYATKTNAYTFSSPAIDGEMGYIGAANGRLFGINLKSGKIEWEFKTEGRATNEVLLFNEEGIMDAANYKILTEGVSDMPALTAVYRNAFINMGAILSSPVISDQVIYFGSSDGYIYAISDK